MELLGRLNKKNGNIALLIAAIILFSFNIYDLDYSNFRWETNSDNLLRLLSNIILILLFTFNLIKIHTTNKKGN